MPRPRILSDEERETRQLESKKKHDKKRNEHAISLRLTKELLDKLDGSAKFLEMTRRQLLLKLITDHLDSNNH